MKCIAKHIINPRISAVWSTTKPIAKFSCTSCVQEVHTKAKVVHLTDGLQGYGSDKSRAFDPEKMMKSINRGAEKSWKRAGQEEAELFGDIWGKEPPKWNMPQPPKDVSEEDQVDVDEILDEIED